MSKDLLSHNLVVRISPSLWGELLTAAERQGISASGLVRRAVTAEIGDRRIECTDAQRPSLALAS